MKQIIKFSKEEMGAIKTIAGIECGNISCAGCPLSLSKRFSLSTPDCGCFRNMALSIVAHEKEEEDNEK